MILPHWCVVKVKQDNARKTPSTGVEQTSWVPFHSPPFPSPSHHGICCGIAIVLPLFAGSGLPEGG